MDVIIDWNLGNMIYHGLITLRLYGFPIAEIGVVSLHVIKYWTYKKIKLNQLNLKMNQY